MSTRPRSRRAAALCALATAAVLLASCSGSSHKAGPATIATFMAAGQRYVAAVDPANAALGPMLEKALAYSGGSAADMDAAAKPTATTLRKAASTIAAINPPEPLHRDMGDVVQALNVVVGDLDGLPGAKGDAIPTAVAQLVADAGREMAADNVVRLAITQLTTPTTEPPPTLEPATLPTTTTTLSRRTGTTRPRTTTTTRSLTTTTRRLTTTTSKP